MMVLATCTPQATGISRVECKCLSNQGWIVSVPYSDPSVLSAREQDPLAGDLCSGAGVVSLWCAERVGLS